MVTHGHMLVNGKKVDIPSYNVAVGDVISLREKSRDTELFKDNFLGSPVYVPYLSKDEAAFSGRLERLPQREEIPVQIEDSLVVEFYTKIM